MEKSHTQNKQRLYGTYSEFIHSIDTRREVLMEKYVLQPDEVILFEDTPELRAAILTLTKKG